MPSKPITNDRLYDALVQLEVRIGKKIDDTSRDHKQELADLRRQFETLEAGRLTRAEGNISDLRLDLQKAITGFNVQDNSIKQNQAVWSGKLVILGTLGAITLAALLDALALKLVGIIK